VVCAGGATDHVILHVGGGVQELPHPYLLEQDYGVICNLFSTPLTRLKLKLQLQHELEL